MKRYIIATVMASALAASSFAFGQAVTHADRSGTITLGGTAQVLAPAWSGRHGCAIQNQSAGDLWVNGTGTATASQPSFRIPPGAEYFCGSGQIGTASSGAISIFGATTAQAFAAREW